MRSSVVLIVAAVPQVLCKCDNDFAGAVSDRLHLFDKGCWGPGSIIDLNCSAAGVKERRAYNTTIAPWIEGLDTIRAGGFADFAARYNGSALEEWAKAEPYAGYAEASPSACVLWCVMRSLSIQAVIITDGDYMGRAEGSAAVALWDATSVRQPGACQCFACPRSGTNFSGAFDNSRCGLQRGWHKLYEVPLQCAGKERSECFDDRDCGGDGSCCYAQGTVPESAIWALSRNMIEWVFLVIAAAFVVQVVVYAIIRLHRIRRPHAHGDAEWAPHEELSERMLEDLTWQYGELFDSLPTAPLPADGTGTACSICLEALSAPACGDAVRGSCDGEGRCVAVPPCAHRFHLGCIRACVMHELHKQRPPLCPNCRVRIAPAAVPPDPGAVERDADSLSSDQDEARDLRTFSAGAATSTPEQAALDDGADSSGAADAGPGGGAGQQDGAGSQDARPGVDSWQRGTRRGSQHSSHSSQPAV